MGGDGINNVWPPLTTTALAPEKDSASPAPATIRGYCKDCLFLVQEWRLQWKKHLGAIQEYMELDRYCQLCDIFKAEDGYCDCFTDRT